MKRSFLSIGSNLNQIAAVANASGSVYQKDIEDLQAEYKYFRDVMKNYLSEISPTYIK
ncbi:MAG: plasmid mobilization relaxosome protein MobC [Oscillospiraceae bacterium]|nr:plasmid mobilization relaxosome protein MobC [Oscillospiraceae bacterium]